MRVPLMRALRRPDGIALALGALGRLALANRRTLRSPRDVGTGLALLRQLVLAEGDAATARAGLTQAVTVLRDRGQVWAIPPRWQELARASHAQGQPERAPPAHPSWWATRG